MYNDDLVGIYDERIEDSLRKLAAFLQVNNIASWIHGIECVPSRIKIPSNVIIDYTVNQRPHYLLADNVYKYIHDEVSNWRNLLQIGDSNYYKGGIVWLKEEVYFSFNDALSLWVPDDEYCEFKFGKVCSC